MPEGVEVHGGPGRNPELLGKIAPALQYLAHERLPAWHVAIGLEIPAAHDMPFALFDQVLNSFEQGRFEFLDPLVQNYFVVVENKTLILLAQFGGDPEGRNRFGGTFLPLPEPNRVDMGITNQV